MLSSVSLCAYWFHSVRYISFVSPWLLIHSYCILLLLLLLQYPVVIPVVWATFHNWWCAKKKKKKEEMNTVRFQTGCLQEWIIALPLLFHCKAVLLLCLCFIVRSHRTAVIALLSLMVIIALTLIALFPKEEICNMITWLLCKCWIHSYCAVPQRTDAWLLCNYWLHSYCAIPQRKDAW